MKPIILCAFALAAIAGSTFGAMDERTIAVGLDSHNRALHIKDGWMRDPCIVLAPDGVYYLTGTTFQPGDPAESSDRYNLGLGKQSRVGWKAQVWRSRDLIKWEHLGAPFSLQDGVWFKEQPALFVKVDSDKVTGPYGERKFAGRFLGHGTPFQDEKGRWWCTAFFNANHPPLSSEGIEARDLSDDAQTINEQGVTIVPLEFHMVEGEVVVRAKDPRVGPRSARRGVTPRPRTASPARSIPPTPSQITRWTFSPGPDSGTSRSSFISRSTRRTSRCTLTNRTSRSTRRCISRKAGMLFAKRGWHDRSNLGSCPTTLL